MLTETIDLTSRSQAGLAPVLSGKHAPVILALLAREAAVASEKPSADG